MFEPQNAFEFAGYYLADLVNKMEGGDYPSKVCFYGGDAEYVAIFGEMVKGRDYDDVITMFTNSPPEGVIFGASMVLVGDKRSKTENILLEVFDYTNPLRAAMAIPFRRKSLLKPLQVGEPETLEVWGDLAENQTFLGIAETCLLMGCKAFPQSSPVWDALKGFHLPNPAR